MTYLQPIQITHIVSNQGLFLFCFSVQLDLELIPLSVRLIGLVELEIDLKFTSFTITLFSADLMRYRAPSIRKTIFKIEKKEQDESVPDLATSSPQQVIV